MELQEFLKETKKLQNIGMAICFLSDDPKGLLEAFDEATQNRQRGSTKPSIDTWRRLLHPDGGRYYTHTDKSKQWADKALLQPVLKNGQLDFHVKEFSPQVPVTRPVYGFYVGHLIETFINHFDTKIHRSEHDARWRCK